jgi:hypothetical protein
VPDERKRKKGRAAALATLKWFNPERVYTLSAFPAAPAIAKVPSPFSHSSAVVLTGKLPPIEDHTELDKVGR